MLAAINQHAKGQHHCQKLTDEDVRLIRLCVAEREQLLKEARKLTNAALAEKFGIHKNTVDAIANFRKWIHVHV